MSTYFRIGSLQILNIIAFVAMVVVNGLADFLPINGQTTGEISNKYPNLFVPAPVTFSIWAVIYAFLFLFIIYQGSTLFEHEKRFIDTKEKIVQLIGYRFILSCLLNISWILAWHYDLILLSVFIMIGLLATLISIFLQLQKARAHISLKKRWFVFAPFSIYLGWISIATIANVTALLVSVGWDGMGFSEVAWTIIMIVTGTLLALLMLIGRSNYFYAFTIVWALTGIIIKQRSLGTTLNAISITALVSSIVILLLLVLLLLREDREPKAVVNKPVNPK